MPNPLIVPPSAEASDDEGNEQEDSSSSSKQDTVTVTECPRKASLTVPDLDDDYDDEEETVEIVEIESIPAVEVEKHDTVTLVYSQEKENKPLIEEKIETKLDNKDDLTDTQIVSVVTENEIQLDNDEQLIEEKVINEPSPKEACLVNGFTWKYGTSHTVEDPLFPFSEAVEDDKPLLRNRFKKRLSQVNQSLFTIF